MHPPFSDLIGTLFKTSHPAIYDIEFQRHLKNAPWAHWLSQKYYFNVVDEYIDTFIHWIYSSKNNKFSKDLKSESKRYKRKDIIIGTTQSFDEAYFRYKNRRLRLFRGEYGYHTRCYTNYSYLDHPPKGNDSIGEWAEPLGVKDWVILSHPFCGTGDQHPRLKELFDKCEEKNIPLLLDCAWFGTCYDLNFDSLNHPAITEVSFSLSKGIGLGYMRTGLRFSNYPEKENMPIAQHNFYKHLALSHCQIGIYQMKEFSPDWQAYKYLKWYEQLCESYNLLKTKCLHVSRLPLESPYAPHFLIDGTYAKVGVREAFKAIKKKELILSDQTLF